MKKPKVFLLLHLMLAIYSMGGIFSKLAGTQSFLSMKFIFYYGMVLALLMFYAVGWQQIIKRMPLTTAFANKAVTVVWGLVWGVLFFHEKITVGKLLGVALIVVGVALFARADQEAENVE